jgi:hypothetical protein
MEGRLPVRNLLVPVGLALLLAAATVIPVSASEASRRVTVDVHGTFDSPTGTFTARGPICGSGITSDVVVVTSKGPRLYFDDRKTFTCADGSGTFTFHVLASVRPCDQFDHGTWKVVGGTGRYGELRGAGTDIGRYFPGDSCNADGIDDIFTGVMGS